MTAPAAAGQGVVVAVSGSVGKTTTALLARAACGDAAVRVVEVHDLDPDLPPPQTGVVTALVGGDDTVVRVTAGLLDHLPDAATAILNVDDDRVVDLGHRCVGKVLRVSCLHGSGADVVAHDVRLDPRARARFGARTPWGDVEVRLPVAGRHHVANALCALAVAGVAGSDIAAAAACLDAADVAAGSVLELEGLTVLVDTAHANPVSTLAALQALEDMQVAGRRVGVLGPMHGLDGVHEVEHWRVGMRAARVLDRLVVVGRSATPITAGARDAAMAHVELVDDADDALAVLDDLGTGDAVLVKAGRSAGLDAVVAGLRRRREGSTP